MTLTITAFYASALAVILIYLRTVVTIERAKSGISILHQDNMALAEKIRRHGNFIENVPHSLILLGLIEIMAAPTLMLHLVGGLLLASRILHPFGLTTEKAAHPLRIFSGVLGTISMLFAVGFIFWNLSQTG